jgi:hypothetical protein
MVLFYWLTSSHTDCYRYHKPTADTYRIVGVLVWPSRCVRFSIMYITLTRFPRDQYWWLSRRTRDVRHSNRHTSGFERNSNSNYPLHLPGNMECTWVDCFHDSFTQIFLPSRNQIQHGYVCISVFMGVSSTMTLGNPLGQLSSHLRPTYSLVQPHQFIRYRSIPLRDGLDDPRSERFP